MLLLIKHFSHVWLWELDYEESWALKNWCFWTVVLEKTLESPLDGKEIQLIHPKGNESRIFIGRTDTEAETPLLWLYYVKNRLTRKDPDWERLKVGGEGDDRERDGWMASLMWWTWVWVGFGSWGKTGNPGLLQSMGWQRVGHNWVTELNYIVYFEPNRWQSKNVEYLKLKKKDNNNFFLNIIWRAQTSHCLYIPTVLISRLQLGCCCSVAKSYLTLLLPYGQ